MYQLACILLHVDTGNADTLLALGGLDLHIAMLTNWQVILGGLPVLWQIRIVVVLAVKLGEVINLAVQGKACLDGKLQHPLVQYRQYARQSQAYRAHMCIVLCTKGGGTATENLCIGL